MRGKLILVINVVGILRNIPAYAGKTISAPALEKESTEHPRVCGENSLAINGSHQLSGTSPRMRGKP